MTYFDTSQHDIDCNCHQCNDVDYAKSIARELERYVEDLMYYSAKNLSKEQFEYTYNVLTKIDCLRRYFPMRELPRKHRRLIESMHED
jgi:hypothetical protein